MRLIAFLLLSTVFAPTGWASPALRAKFAATFNELYRPGRCGVNIAELLRAAARDGIDISAARVGVITNDGYLLSVTNRRNSGPPLPSPVNENRFAPGISNFYHHVFLEDAGEVYDYDFGNEPHPRPLKSYIKEMFWDEPANTEFSGLERIEERRKYKITFLGAARYLEQLSAEGGAPRRLGELYEQL